MKKVRKGGNNDSDSGRKEILDFSFGWTTCGSCVGDNSIWSRRIESA